jgi:glutamate-ammonia-ligase adenylyltransferase
MTCIALGKLGGREMTPTSDLDLIFVYDTPAGIEASDGPRPLPPSQYFARLSQRLINAVTAQTAEGRLFEVDMRLRPSGAKGPIASSLKAFIQYHEEAAWTWEHMALTRARVVFGPEDLWRRVEAVIRETLTKPRNPDVLLRDVADMRARLDAEHHSDFVWEVKYMRGGQVDIDFIAQYLQLKHAHTHPQVLSANTRTALRALRDNGLLAASVADGLIAALDLWQGVQSVLRLTIEGFFQRNRETEVTAVGAAADVTALKEKILATAAAVYGHFRDLIENPDRDLPAKAEE